jgi:hypothetical protein
MSVVAFTKISTKKKISTFFVCYRVFRCFSAMGVQKHNKKRFTKKSCGKYFTKKSEKNPKPIVSRLFLSRFWAFLGEGVKQQDKKYRKKSDQPWYFLGLRGTNQPRQGPSFFVWAPCARCNKAQISPPQDARNYEMGISPDVLVRCVLDCGCPLSSAEGGASGLRRSPAARRAAAQGGAQGGGTTPPQRFLRSLWAGEGLWAY